MKGCFPIHCIYRMRTKLMAGLPLNANQFIGSPFATKKNIKNIPTKTFVFCEN